MTHITVFFSETQHPGGEEVLLENGGTLSFVKLLLATPLSSVLCIDIKHGCLLNDNAIARGR